MGLQFLDGALDSHPSFPSRATSGRCILSAAAACVPNGVVSALAESSSWRNGVVPVVAGVRFGSLLPTPLRMVVVHRLPRCVSVDMRSVGLLYKRSPFASLPTGGPCTREEC